MMINQRLWLTRREVVTLRKYSTIESSLVQLSEDIEYVYNDLIIKTNFSMSRSELAVIQQRLLSGLYVLSPLRIKGVEKENLSKFLLENLSSCPDCLYHPCNSNPDIFIVIMPEKADDLVLMGLSRMLYRRSKGSFPKDGYRLSNEVESFYSSISEMGKVNRLYQIEISDTKIPVNQVLNMVRHYVEEGSVCYNLINSFVNLPYKDDIGTLVYLNRLPFAGEITRVLLNLIYINLIDKEFKKAFEGVAYSRFISLVIIATKEDEESIFNEDIAEAFIDYLNLDAEVTSIGPGDEPIQCGVKKVVLDKESKVLVY